ncbi:MAG: hypothetical protein HC806_00830, partial [Anaerolineae bacterium]|nr:hypothetical protein [Anaerolineae bacterium]
MSSETKPAARDDSARLIPRWLAWTLILGLAAGIAIWKPGQNTPGVNPEGWRLLAVFLPCILALMLAPIPGGAVVLLAVVASVVIGALTLPVALDGYADASVWMVLAAYFLARAFIKTGLARRIALQFIRLMGRSTLGLGYALVATDTLLAAMIPSVAARIGGVTLPIARSLSELYQSFPGESAAAHRALPDAGAVSGRRDGVRAVLHRAGEQSAGGTTGARTDRQPARRPGGARLRQLVSLCERAGAALADGHPWLGVP